MVKVNVSFVFNGPNKYLTLLQKQIEENKHISGQSYLMDIASSENKSETGCMKTRSKSKEANNTNKDNNTSLEHFKKTYNPTVSVYTDKSILIKTNKTVSEKDKKFFSSDLVKPLYYNAKLGGWISSLDNMQSFSVEQDKGLEAYIKKYDLKFVHDHDQLYDTVSSRVLYLRSTTFKTPSKSDIVFKSSELKHGLFYNDAFEVWQTSTSNKPVLEKYTTTIPDSDDESYNDSLSEMSDESEYDDALSHLKFTKYGKGLIIRPKKNDQNYGEKYFHGGFWNESLKGWVFSQSKRSSLEELGATYVKA